MSAGYIDISVRASRAIEAAKMGATLYVCDMSGQWHMVKPEHKIATIARAERMGFPGNGCYGVHVDWRNEIKL